MLLTANEIGNFTCRAHCDSPCVGKWVIDNETVQNAESNSEHSKWSKKGFTFQKFSLENEYVLRLSVNASTANNNSVIQCEYYYSAIVGVETMFAKILVISGEYTLTCMRYKQF